MDEWKEWKQYVLKELESCDQSLEYIRSDVQDIKIEIATLKARASAWGAIAGLIPGVALALWQFLR